MFQSATFKLTIWYAAIIVVISLLFSIIIYGLASNAIESKFDSYVEDASQFPYIVNQGPLEYLHTIQVKRAEASLIGALVITNLAIWGAGGIGSYYLARRTLRPIEQAHEAQSRFSSDASHELRTPLASMKLELEVALRDPNLKKEEMRELLKSNLEEVDKLSKLAHVLLQLSRLDHTAVKKSRVKLDDIVQTVVQRHDREGSRISVTPHIKPVYVLAHKESIEELVTILVDNALKYSDKDSPITISLKRANKRGVFSISNSGKGIEAKDLPHIFERFYRADSSRTGGSQSGYGLGLSLAKQIIEHHNGELSASSAPGALTTFIFSLPIFSLSKVKNK